MYFLVIILIVCILYVGYVGHTYILHNNFLDSGIWIKDCICGSGESIPSDPGELTFNICSFVLNVAHQMHGHC